MKPVKIDVFAHNAMAIQMVFAILEWLREQPAEVMKPFLFARYFSVDMDQPASPLIMGRLDNQIYFSVFLELKEEARAALPEDAVFYLHEDKQRKKELAQWTGEFRSVTLATGNKRLEFVPFD